MQINSKNHLSCNPQHDHVYGFSDKRKDYKISEKAIERAIQLLFGEVTKAQEKELFRIAKSQFADHGSVVWIGDNHPCKFKEFLEKYSLEIGTKEVIILGDGKSIQYTDDFHYYPELV